MAGQRFDSILLFGTPGVGKGTQGKMIGRTRSLFHVSSGDIFRGLDPNSAEGQQTQQRIANGELIPDELTIRIWRNWLDDQIAQFAFLPQEQLLLLDGIPRNIQQCGMLDQHISVVKLIHLASADDQPMIDRIKERAVKDGRPDDSDETVIRHRFDVYRAETAPVLDFYSNDLVSDIDPIGTPTEVFKRIFECLLPVLKEFRGEEFDADQL